MNVPPNSTSKIPTRESAPYHQDFGVQQSTPLYPSSPSGSGSRSSSEKEHRTIQATHQGKTLTLTVSGSKNSKEGVTIHQARYDDPQIGLQSRKEERPLVGRQAPQTGSQIPQGRRLASAQSSRAQAVPQSTVNDLKFLDVKKVKCDSIYDNGRGGFGGGISYDPTKFCSVGTAGPEQSVEGGHMTTKEVGAKVHVTCEDFLGPIQVTSTTTVGSQLFTSLLGASNMRNLRFRSFCRLYAKVKVNYLRIIYRPYVSSITNGALAIGIVTDPSYNWPIGDAVNRVIAGLAAQAWPLVWHESVVEIKPEEGIFTAQGVDVRWFNVANLVVAAASDFTSNMTTGGLFIQGSYEFSEPAIGTRVFGSGFILDSATDGATSMSMSYPLGTKSDLVPRSGSDLYYYYRPDTTSRLYFGPGNYYMGIRIVGTGFSGSFNFTAGPATTLSDTFNTISGGLNGVTGWIQFRVLQSSNPYDMYISLAFSAATTVTSHLIYCVATPDWLPMADPYGVPFIIRTDKANPPPLVKSLGITSSVDETPCPVQEEHTFDEDVSEIQIDTPSGPITFKKV